MKERNRKEIFEIHKLALPILCHYLLSTFFEFLDEAIVGHYSMEGFALVGMAASIIYAATGALGVLSSAFNILAADKKGKQDDKSFLELFRASKFLVILIGLGFILLSVIGGKYFFERVYHLKGESLTITLSYFYPDTITVLQNLIIFQYSSFFRNKLNTTISLYVTGVSIVINLFFDYSLVYGKFGLPELGVAGAAWGSVIGLCCGLFIYQYAYLKEVGFNLHIHLKYWREIGKLYPALLGQELLEGSIFVLVVTIVITRLGTSQLAIYKLLDLFSGAIGLPAFAYASATQTYALQNFSTGKKKKVSSYLKAGILSGMVIISILCISGFGWHDYMFRWVIGDCEVMGAAGEYWGLISFYILLKVPYQIYMSYLQGVGKEHFVLGCTSIGTAVSSVMVMIFGGFLGLKGIYLVMSLEYTILIIIYRHQYFKSIGD